MKKAHEEPATKVDLIILEGKIDDKLEKMREENKGYRDEVLNGLDKIVKELETMREGNAVGTLKLES